VIDRSIIARVMEAAQVEEIVGDYVSLKKRGPHFVGLCPFHNEKTPSFVVTPAKGIYKCFGCGKAGTAATFLQEHEGMNFGEAIEFLAQKYGIPMASQTPEDRQRFDAEETLYVVNSFAQRHYSDNLFGTEEGKAVGLAYLKERGFREDTIRKFQLGYALESGDALTRTALTQGHRLELLKELGLTIERDSRRFDFFRGRVIFPVHNLSGKVAAFGGRTMTKEGGPKYVNSPESAVYVKSRSLYGMFQARTAIRQLDRCVLVEGYTDVISLHQNGFENVVASSGTSLTEEQIRLIRRFTQNVIILYDGDSAGVKASMRGVDLLLAGGLNVQVVILPEKEDPDSYVKLVGATEFNAYLKDRAADFLLFKTRELLREALPGPAGKAEVIKSTVESIARIPDPIRRALYLKECGTLMQVEERLLITEMNRVLRSEMYRAGSINQVQREDFEKLTRPSDPAPQQIFTVSGEAQERDVIRVLLEYGELEYQPGMNVATFIVQSLADAQIENPIYASILNTYRDELGQGHVPGSTAFVQSREPEVAKVAIDLITEKYEVSKNWEKKYDIIILPKSENYKRDVYSAVTRFQLWHTMMLIEENRRQQKVADSLESQSDLIRIRMHLDEQKAKLSHELATVIKR
jgi:DNA primase